MTSSWKIVIEGATEDDILNMDEVYEADTAGEAMDMALEDLNRMDDWRTVDSPFTEEDWKYNPYVIVMDPSEYDHPHDITISAELMEEQQKADCVTEDQ